ncbi:MAG: hypothetical protein J2P46_12430 [Zavarzinella sp.]|nr:hypothetical protein [Zavarzinella sp.]
MSRVTHAEAVVQAETVHRRAGILWRLTARSGRTQDPLYREVFTACGAVNARWAALHYRGCGATKPPGPDSGCGPDPPGDTLQVGR